MECKFCELDILREEYVEHQNGCGSRTDFCEFCNQRVMLKDMAEHKQTKCGHMKSEYTMSSYDLRQRSFDEQESGVYDVNRAQEEILLSRGGGGGRPSNFPPLHAYHHSVPPLSPPPNYDAHKDNSVHVDPQWLASVADVCGKDNMDQVLEQNLRAVENYGTSSGVGLHSSSDGASGRDVEGFRSGKIIVMSLFFFKLRINWNHC